MPLCICPEQRQHILVTLYHPFYSHSPSPKNPSLTPAGNYREALPIYSEALRIYREVYGAEHPSIAEILLVVAGFQNTFMNDMQQYIEHINTR